MAKNPRHYTGKDVDMLTVLSTVIANAEANQTTLQEKRTNLTTEYLADLEKRLNDIIKKYFGVDNAKQLRQQTIVVYSIQGPAYAAASVMKANIESSYNTDKKTQKEILRELGYTDYFKAAANDDTEALINLIYQYQQNMMPDLQSQLAATGISVSTITLVSSYADTLRTSNISQESFKSTKKVLTADTLQVYNSIYDEVVGKICKLARIFFPGSPSQQQLFSYTGLLKAMNISRKKAESSTTPA